MSENISVPAAVSDPLNAKELILAYIAKLLNNENPAEPRNTSRVDEAMIYVANIIANSSGGGGGSGLPDVTAEDNGKFLGVENAEWKALAAPGGNDDVFVVTIEKTDWPVEGISSDKTYSEIKAAYDNGKLILAHTIGCALEGPWIHSFGVMKPYGGMMGLEGFCSVFNGISPHTMDMFAGKAAISIISINTTNDINISSLGNITISTDA